MLNYNCFALINLSTRRQTEDNIRYRLIINSKCDLFDDVRNEKLAHTFFVNENSIRGFHPSEFRQITFILWTYFHKFRVVKCTWK